jgi:mRNA-degrading endonuclease RelE of RelBE toxin-antitoxin system
MSVVIAAKVRQGPQRVGKPLERELSGSFSACRGPYRVLYRIDEEAKRVTIQRVAHRADVYRPGDTFGAAGVGVVW